MKKIILITLIILTIISCSSRKSEVSKTDIVQDTSVKTEIVEDNNINFKKVEDNTKITDYNSFFEEDDVIIEPIDEKEDMFIGDKRFKNIKFSKKKKKHVFNNKIVENNKKITDSLVNNKLQFKQDFDNKLDLSKKDKKTEKFNFNILIIIVIMVIGFLIYKNKKQ